MWCLEEQCGPCGLRESGVEAEVTLGSGVPHTGAAMVRRVLSRRWGPQRRWTELLQLMQGAGRADLVWAWRHGHQARMWTGAHTQRLSRHRRWTWAQISDPSCPRQPRHNRQELTGNGSDLRVDGRWRPCFLLNFHQLSLYQLSLVIWNFWRLGLPHPGSRGWGQGLRPDSVCCSGDTGSSHWRGIATLLLESHVLPALAFDISWFTCFISRLLEEWDASVLVTAENKTKLL